MGEWLNTWVRPAFALLAAGLAVYWTVKAVWTFRRARRWTTRFVETRTATQQRLARGRIGESFDTFKRYFDLLGVDPLVTRHAWNYLTALAYVPDFPFHPEDDLLEVVGLGLAPDAPPLTGDDVDAEEAIEEIVLACTGEWPGKRDWFEADVRTVEDLVLYADTLVKHVEERSGSGVRG